MIVDGINVVRELLKNCKVVDKIIAIDSPNVELNNVLDKARGMGIKVEVLPKEKFFSNFTSQQGIVAFIPNFKYCELSDILAVSKNKSSKAFIVILDGIEDPHNLGAIIRTCECAGVDGIIIPKNRAVDVNATVFKTSAGAAIHTKIAMVTNINSAIETLKKAGVWVYGLEAGEKSIYNADFTYPTALVIGSEGKGISRLVKQNCDEILSINMYGLVNSLNASNAAAIGIYEVVRQRSK